MRVAKPFKIGPQMLLSWRGIIVATLLAVVLSACGGGSVGGTDVGDGGSDGGGSGNDGGGSDGGGSGSDGGGSGSDGGGSDGGGSDGSDGGGGGSDGGGSGGTVVAQGQLSSPVEEIIIQRYADHNDIVFGQKAQGGLLVLTPDSSFFSPTGPRLTGQAASNIPGASMNGGYTYSTVNSIKKIGQKIIWPIMPASTGLVDIDVYLEADQDLAGSTVIVRLGELVQQVTVMESDGTAPQPWGLTANITQSGVSAAAIQNLEIELVNLNGANELGDIHKIEIQGTSLKNGYLLRTRWRPVAIHSRFDSSGLKASGLNAHMWVMEVKPDFSQPDAMGFYAPITTRFGYYGTTFSPASGTSTSAFTSSTLNFSFWSFGADAPKPPLPKHSHLLSLGDPTQVFDGFNHEGTGVKPTGFNPFQGHTMDSVVIALRLEPAVEEDTYRYNTYMSYFLDPASGDWKLYATGRKYITNFTTAKNQLRMPGSFIEVPGAPTSQRTGQIPRIAEFRGWVQDISGDWHSIDIMNGGAPSTNPAAKNWTSAGNGWFRMSMGGIILQKYHSKPLSYQSEAGPLPEYMQPYKLSVLSTEPAGAEVHGVVIKSGGDFELDFTLTNVDADAEVKLYYGDEDALTLIFEKHNTLTDEWDRKISLGNLSSGRYVLSIPSADLPGITDSGYCRILVTTSQGRYWSRKTASWSAGNQENAFWAPITPMTLSSAATVGSLVGSVSVSSPSQYSNVTYAIKSGNEQGHFSINPTTGVIAVARPLPQVSPTYKLLVQADTGDASTRIFLSNVSIATTLDGSRWKIEDSFDQGDSGASLKGMNSGSGWRGSWTGDESWTLQAPGISFPGISSNGLKVKMGAKGSTISRSFNKTIEVGDGATQLSDAWVSILINMVEPVANGYAVRLGLINDGSDVGYMGKAMNGPLGFQLGGSGWKPISGDVGKSSGTQGTWLFILHLEADGAGNVTASLNVGKNTEVGSSPALEDLTHLASTTISGSVQFDSAQFSRHNDANSAVDEITISGYNPLTPPASNPSPVNGATAIEKPNILSWDAANGADSYNIYFGTTEPGTLQGNQTDLNFDPGTLLSSTTYYWRVDTVSASGTTPGTVWSFMTMPSP